MAERIILDPSEVATGRTELDITNWISQAGVDYGDAQLTAYMAELSVGSSVVDYRVPNRQISIPLVIRDMGGTTFAAARAAIQAKVGIWQQQGGWIKRVTSSGGTVFADVVTASLKLGGDWLQANRDADINASITLETIPDFYKAEETLSDHTETTLPDITFTETTANGGDFPLGDRVRVVVDDDQGQNQRGLIWAFRGKNYSAATTAASAYEAEALTPLDTAARAAKVGASGGTVVTHGTLSTNWTPVLSTNLAAGTYLTHTGTNRLYARVLSTSGTAVQARFVYDVGDLVYPTENDAVRLYDGGTFHILDLGEVRLDQPANTTGYRWQGQIQAKGNAGGEALSIDRVMIVNSDDASGLLRATTPVSRGLSSFSARSDFTTESGAITGDSLQVGGTWAGAGDTDDFSVTAGVCTRTAVTDASSSLSSGRLVTASATSSMTNQAASVRVMSSSPFAGLGGVLLRYVDTSNFAAAYVSNPGNGGPANVLFMKRVGGVDTTITLPSAVTNLNGVFVEVGGAILSDGTYVVFAGVPSLTTVLLSGFDSVFATGNTLATGKTGIVDLYTPAVSATRTYAGFGTWAPSPDAVVFASRSAELNTLGNTRQDTGGTAYGPVSSVVGDVPRIPNRSSAGTVEVFLKGSRGDLQATPDTGIDDISARVYRRASYLTVG